MKQNKNIPEGYKDSPLGIIPDEWEVKRLENICSTFKSGQGITSKNITTQGFYPVYGGNGLRGYTNTYTHKGKYILIGRQGALCGNINFVNGENYISEHAIAVQTNKENNIDFWKYKLEALNLNKYSESSAQPGLSVEKLLRLKVSAPTLIEQKNIASILFIWDEAIKKQTEIIEKLEVRKRGLMQQLLTGKKRLPGFNGKWNNKKLKEITERIVRKNTENCKNIVTISAQKGFIPQTDFFNKVIASETIESYYLVYKNEFCYNKSYSNGYPMGAIKRLVNFEKAVVTTLYICFKINSELNSYFMEQYFEAGLLNKGLSKIANEGGRAHGLLNVTPSDFFNLSINIPPIEEQNALSNILYISDLETKLAIQKLEQLKNEKKGLIQVLLTGKKRIFF